MRRFFAALVVASLALTLSGCGGGDDGGEAAQVDAVPTATVDAAASGSGSTTEPVDISDPEPDVTFEPFPVGSKVPPTIADNIEAGQPMLLLFYDGSMKDTDDVRSAVNKAMKANRGIVELMSYDLGEYTSVNSSGAVVVAEEDLLEDKNAGQVLILSREVGVKLLPYIIMTDDQGFIVFRHSGLVDAEYLKMHMERLTD